MRKIKTFYRKEVLSKSETFLALLGLDLALFTLIIVLLGK